jgi:hypothetical protein
LYIISGAILTPRAGCAGNNSALDILQFSNFTRLIDMGIRLKGASSGSIAQTSYKQFSPENR